MPSPHLRRLFVSAAVVGVTVLAGCGGGEGGGAAPEAAGSGGDIAAGEQAFSTYCIACHGQAGTGTEQGPPLVHVVYEPSHHGDDAFRSAARNGVQPHHWEFGPMPPVAGITDDELDAVIAYLRQLQRDAGIE